MDRRRLKVLASKPSIVAMGHRHCSICRTGLFAKPEFMTPHEFNCYKANGYIPPEHVEQFRSTMQTENRIRRMRLVHTKRAQERMKHLFVRKGQS